MKKLLLILFALTITLQAQIIPNGETRSSVYEVGTSYIWGETSDEILFVFKVPTSFDGSTITIYTSTSSDTSTFWTARPSDSNVDQTITVTAGEYYYLKLHEWYWLQAYILFESNTSATGADTLEVIDKGIIGDL